MQRETRVRRIIRRSVVLAFIATACRPGPVSDRETVDFDEVRPALEREVVRGLDSGESEQDSLRRDALMLYARRDFAPLWQDQQGFSPAALATLRALWHADEHGLRVEDYVSAELAESEPRDGRIDSADTRARAEIALSVSAMRYIRELHEGRVDPARAGLHMGFSHHHPNIVEEVVAVANSLDAAATLEQFAPPYPQYRALADALERYRRLAALDESSQPLSEAATVHPGDDYPDRALLQSRLLATGDWVGEIGPEDDAPGQPLRYDGGLVSAVRRFQTRHGLNDDGVLGSRTLAELNVPFRNRASQIIASMERWRWVSEHFDGTPLVINIPEFRVRGIETRGETHQSSFESRIIVGRHYEKFRTPIFSGRLEYLDFRPFWNVPASIIRNELSPSLDDPGFLDEHGYEIVAGTSLDAVPLPHTAENVAAVRSGTLRLRQRPGGGNALGAVKFIFPNPHSVFLHGTPAMSLFDKEERAFSHGCIRVADARGLAEWVLRGQEGWSPESIARALVAARTERVPVARNIPVYILYLTAFVDSAAGRVHFANDVYGLDAALLSALEPGDVATSAEPAPYRRE